MMRVIDLTILRNSAQSVVLWSPPVTDGGFALVFCWATHRGMQRVCASSSLGLGLGVSFVGVVCHQIIRLLQKNCLLLVTISPSSLNKEREKWKEKQ